MFDKFQKAERHTTTTERRHSRRYVLSAPVLFRWHISGGGECQGGGFTRDVSARGTFITCDEACPPVATGVSIELLLPSLDAEAVGLKLKAEGLVVRSACFAEGKGFAVETDFTASERALALEGD